MVKSTTKSHGRNSARYAFDDTTMDKLRELAVWQRRNQRQVLEMLIDAEWESMRRLDKVATRPR